MRLLAALAALAAASACTQTVDLDPLAGLTTLSISPAADAIAITDLSEPPHVLAFTATGHFSDGSDRDVTALVAWSADLAAPGSFAAPGSYVTSNAAAGHITISATGENLTATAALTITISATIVDGAFPPPADPAMLFASGLPHVSGDPMHGPSLLYPNDGTLYPQGVARELVQYDVATNDAFKLTFDNDVLHLTVLTGADRWLADTQLWSLIAASGIASPIRVGLAAASSKSPGTIYDGSPITLAFSHDAPGGLLYYFSAATNGLTRGALDATGAPEIYPSSGNDCVGCHAVSRDGNRIAMGLGGETLQVLDAPTLAPLAVPKRPMGWAAFSPDGRRLLVANKGALTLLDATTGAPVGSPDGRVALPPMMFATHPDWSPDGAYVAVALTAATPNNMDVKAASIARLPVTGDKLGAPEILVAAQGTGDNNYFPRYSPDGRYLAFVHATTSSKGALDAELRIVTAAGGTPVALRLASHRAGTTDDVPDLATTMPSWAPTIGEHAWLAFASTRGYGSVLTSPRTQIWVAGIDLGRFPEDPSGAAFWLPCQDVTVVNNTPIWALAPTEPPR